MASVKSCHRVLSPRSCHSACHTYREFLSHLSLRFCHTCHSDLVIQILSHRSGHTCQSNLIIPVSHVLSQLSLRSCQVLATHPISVLVFQVFPRPCLPQSPMLMASRKGGLEGRLGVNWCTMISLPPPTYWIHLSLAGVLAANYSLSLSLSGCVFMFAQ